MSKITNDGGLTWFGTGCFIAIPIWQKWVKNGRLRACHVPSVLSVCLSVAVVCGLPVSHVNSRRPDVLVDYS